MKTPDKMVFEDETVTIPELVAENVFEELERWLSALLLKYNEPLFRHFPASYANGQELPLHHRHYGTRRFRNEPDG